jgi:hypothetical protein
VARHDQDEKNASARRDLLGTCHVRS